MFLRSAGEFDSKVIKLQTANQNNNSTFCGESKHPLYIGYNKNWKFGGLKPHFCACRQRGPSGKPHQRGSSLDRELRDLNL